MQDWLEEKIEGNELNSLLDIFLYDIHVMLWRFFYRT